MRIIQNFRWLEGKKYWKYDFIRIGSWSSAPLTLNDKRIWDRFELISTPEHGSWLNLAEIELNVLMGQCLNRSIDNMTTIRHEVKAWQQGRNNKKAKINWQLRTDNARVKLKKL